MASNGTLTGNETMATRILYAVRADFNDPSGTATHEYIYGDEPTVFVSELAAVQHAERLRKSAEAANWGQPTPPIYIVEPITEADMWDAESIAECEVTQ